MRQFDPGATGGVGDPARPTRFGRFQAERTDEHAHSSQDGSILLGQEIVAPRDGGLERLMARRCGSASADEQLEAVSQALDDLVEAERAKSDGRELDCERDAVEATRQLGHRGLVVRRDLEAAPASLAARPATRRPPTWATRSGATSPTASGTDNGPTLTTVSPATPRGCLLVARIRSPGASRSSRVGKDRGCIEHVLTVVEQEQLP